MSTPLDTRNNCRNNPRMEPGQTLGIVEILGIAASVSLLAGWRLY